jgi:transposase
VLSEVLLLDVASREPPASRLELDRCLFARACRLAAVSMDMTGGYAKSVREHAPQATIVIDNYHVVALATKALDEVRREY